jgi:hypothetical protein
VNDFGHERTPPVVETDATIRRFVMTEMPTMTLGGR